MPLLGYRHFKGDDRNGLWFFQWAADSEAKTPTTINRWPEFQAGQTVLALLSTNVTPGAEVDSSERYPPPRCHPGTRQWLLTSIKEWVQDDHRQSNFAWLWGHAGVGKSAVAQTVAERAAADGQLGAAYFFSRLQGRDQFTKLWTTIAYQLAVRIPSYRLSVAGQLANDSDIWDKAPSVQFKRLIAEPLASLPPSSKFLVVLDGLDECQSEEAQLNTIELIASITKSSSSSPLVWLACSRPERHLQALFFNADFPIGCWRLELPFDSEETKNDVGLFVRSSFRDIREKYSGAVSRLWPSEDEIRAVVDACSGSFAYACTTMRYVDNAETNDPQGRLGYLIHSLTEPSSKGSYHKVNPFVQLDELYARIISEISEDVQPIRLLHLLGTHILYPSLPILQLANLFGLDRSTFYDCVRPLLPVVNVPVPDRVSQDGLRFYHVSFPDFLIHKRNLIFDKLELYSMTITRTISFDRRLIGLEFIKVCFRVLAQTTPQHAMNLTWPPKKADGISAFSVSHQMLNYCAANVWNACLRLGDIDDSVLCQAIVNFRYPFLRFVKDKIPKSDFLSWIKSVQSQVQKYNLPDIIQPIDMGSNKRIASLSGAAYNVCVPVRCFLLGSESRRVLVLISPELLIFEYPITTLVAPPLLEHRSSLPAEKRTSTTVVEEEFNAPTTVLPGRPALSPDPSRTPDIPTEDPKPDPSPIFMKGRKRKRVAKACDACHKSKRRCDGTAPCSNCYYASKPCTYTDSAGRPVPAPRSFKQEREGHPNQPQPGSSANNYQPAYRVQTLYPTDAPRYPLAQRNYPSIRTTTSVPPLALEATDRFSDRKRFRNDRGNAISSEDIFLDDPTIGVTFDRPAHVELDHALTRELTTLFFTHCHPARVVIHKPSFSNSLSHNRVPKHLLYAVCALAAPLSKQPRIRTNPSRFAGKPFAQEALSLMFDNSGRLVCEPDLPTAQALALLLMHDVVTKDKNTLWNTRYADLALQIIENLGVHEPDYPTLTPMPSPEFIRQSFKREAVRRIFWLIHLLDVMASIYFKKPVTFTSSELRLRLPVDETSFELGVHSTLPEYLHLGAIRTHYASELGHVIRVITIYAQVEFALDGIVNDPQTNMTPQAALVEAERALDSWLDSLPEHLRFSDLNLQIQQSMFETSSNTGAWCWCFMHVYHACCCLALNLARQRSQQGSKTELQWALDAIDMIMNLLGDRAKNSILLGAALYSMVKYGNRDTLEVRAWNAEYETEWGTNMVELVQEYRPQPSSSQHKYSTGSHPQASSQFKRETQEADPQMMTSYELGFESVINQTSSEGSAWLMMRDDDSGGGGSGGDANANKDERDVDVNMNWEGWYR